MLSIGAQWAVLQGVAWIGMAVSYSLEEGSVGEGLSKTFDGDHPCPLCQMVEKGTQGDQSPDSPAPTAKPIPKVEICQTERIFLNFPPALRLPAVSHDLRAASRPVRPSARPPEFQA